VAVDHAETSLQLMKISFTTTAASSTPMRSKECPNEDKRNAPPCFEKKKNVKMKTDYLTSQKRTNRESPQKRRRGFIIANSSEGSTYADVARKLKDNIDIDRRSHQREEDEERRHTNNS